MNGNNVGIVTGAGSGIGKGVALRLLGEGASVLAVDRSQDGLMQLEAECSNANLRTLAADVSAEATGPAAVQACLDAFGALNFLVNAAGIGIDGMTVDETPLAEFQRVLAVNLVGTFIVMGATIRHMKGSGGGSIVNVASSVALRAVPLAGAYVASKFGVVGLTGTAALEGAGHGIRVNALCPGVTDTAMLRNIQGISSELVAQIPLQRVASPMDMADAVAWLISDQASYVTGIALPVDGGLVLA